MMTPQMTHIGDQLIAEVQADLKWLTPAVKAGDAEYGELQNMSNFLAWFRHEDWSAAYLAACLIGALRQNDTSHLNASLVKEKRTRAILRRWRTDNEH